MLNLNHFRIVSILFCLFCIFKTKAQNNFIGLTKPTFALKMKTDSLWSFSLGAAYRDMIYQNANFDFKTQYLELNGFATYSLDRNQDFSIGFRHKFKTLFKSTAMDEKRLIVQYKLAQKSGETHFEQRLRVEERFREINTFRSRYRFEFSLPLRQNKPILKQIFLIAQSEALWSVGHNERPSFDQRIFMGLSKLLSLHTAADIGFQYRFEDYTHQPSHKLIFVLEVAVAL